MEPGAHLEKTPHSPSLTSPAGPIAESPQIAVPFGKYLLLKRLAVGGMAELFLAKDSAGDRLVVIKRILPYLSDEAEFVQMFLDEARIAAQLNHRNVVHTFELGKLDDTIFQAMEYVEGLDLRKVLVEEQRRGRLMPWNIAAYLTAEVCAGLGAAHHASGVDGRPLSIIHRDISPQNVMVAYDGGVKLVDFGIAKAATLVQNSKPGVIKGKFLYLSPEQLTQEKLDHRSDLFALGTVLYEIATGQSPFYKPNTEAIIYAIRGEEPSPPHLMKPELPRELSRIVMRCLTKDRNYRYQDAADIERDLRDLLARECPTGPRELIDYIARLFGEEEERTLLHVPRPSTAELLGRSHATAPLPSPSSRPRATLPTLPTPAVGSGATARQAARRVDPETPARSPALLPRRPTRPSQPISNPFAVRDATELGKPEPLAHSSAKEEANPFSKDESTEMARPELLAALDEQEDRTEIGAFVPADVQRLARSPSVIADPLALLARTDPSPDGTRSTAADRPSARGRTNPAPARSEAPTAPASRPAPAPTRSRLDVPATRSRSDVPTAPASRSRPELPAATHSRSDLRVAVNPGESTSPTHSRSDLLAGVNPGESTSPAHSRSELLAGVNPGESTSPTHSRSDLLAGVNPGETTSPTHSRSDLLAGVNAGETTSPTHSRGDFAAALNAGDATSPTHSRGNVAVALNAGESTSPTHSRGELVAALNAGDATSPTYSRGGIAAALNAGASSPQAPLRHAAEAKAPGEGARSRSRLDAPAALHVPASRSRTNVPTAIGRGAASVGTRSRTELPSVLSSPPIADELTPPPTYPGARRPAVAAPPAEELTPALGSVNDPLGDFADEPDDLTAAPLESEDDEIHTAPALRVRERLAPPVDEQTPAPRSRSLLDPIGPTLLTPTVDDPDTASGLASRDGGRLRPVGDDDDESTMNYPPMADGEEVTSATASGRRPRAWIFAVGGGVALLALMLVVWLVISLVTGDSPPTEVGAAPPPPQSEPVQPPSPDEEAKQADPIPDDRESQPAGAAQEGAARGEAPAEPKPTTVTIRLVAPRGTSVVRANKVLPLKTNLTVPAGPLTLTVRCPVKRAKAQRHTVQLEADAVGVRSLAFCGAKLPN